VDPWVAVVISSDVVIVGGGIEGAAAAWALTRRGAGSVTVLERGTVGCGFTGKSSGIVRCHYGVPSLAAMAWTGVSLFSHAVELLGEDIGFAQVGYVVGVGGANVTALEANVAMQRSLGIETGLISAAAAASLFPYADLSDFSAFAYEPRGGYGDAYRTAQAFAGAARRAGASVRQGALVTEVLVSGRQVTGVRLADGTMLSAGSVVVAAGPWSVGLVSPLGIDLPVRACREQILLIKPGVPLGRLPVFSDLVTLQYVRAEASGELLFGNSDLSEPEWADPDSYRNAADPAFMELAAEKMAGRFPGLGDAVVSSGYAGCYDVTPDFNPMISATDVAGLFIAAGFSGHGFKISPAVGELVADLVCDGASGNRLIPERDFRLSRFAEGKPLVSPHPYAGAGQLR
jgi:sarcosine oxidase, subunit beta